MDKNTLCVVMDSKATKGKDPPGLRQKCTRVNFLYRSLVLDSKDPKKIPGLQSRQTSFVNWYIMTGLRYE